MAKLFLSYRHVEPDATVAQSLYGSLRTKGHSVFLDTEGLQAGDAWDPRLQAEIDKADFFVALVSLAYLNSPYIMDHELSSATKRLKAGRLERLLVVNLAYDGDPPAAAREVLREIQFLKWRSPEDTSRVTEEILRVLPPDEVLVRGMRFFDISDARAFARLGREEEIARFLALLRDEDAGPILLYGVSGAGKTSFLRAGVLPELGGRGTIAEMTGLPSDPVPVPGGAGGVLILDAFERLLRSAAADPKVPATAAALAAWAHPPAGMRQVFAIRDEYRTAFDAMLPDVAARCTQFPLLPLAPAKAGAVLGLLLESARLEYDVSLLLPLCEELADGVPRTVRPALLQILSQALQRRGERVTQGIWDRVKSDGDSLFQEHIRETVLDRVPARVGGSRAIQILEGLTYGAFRSQARTVAEVAEGREISPQDVQETLETAALPHARVVISESAEGEVRYRLIHDLFASAVKVLHGRMSLQAERRRRWRQVLTLSSLLAVAVLALGLAGLFGFQARQGAQRSHDALLLRAFEDAMSSGDSASAFLLVRDTRTDDRLPGWRSAAVAALQNPLPTWQADERMLGVDPGGRRFLSLTPSGRLLVHSVADPRQAVELGRPGAIPDGLLRVVWSKDARHLAITLRTGIGIWDVEAPAAPLLQRPDWTAVSFDATGRLVIGSQKKGLDIWLLGPEVTRAYPPVLLDRSIRGIGCGETPQHCFALAYSNRAELWEVTATSARKIQGWGADQFVSLSRWGQVLAEDYQTAGWNKVRVGATSWGEPLSPVSVTLKGVFPVFSLTAGRDGRFLLVRTVESFGGDSRLWAVDLRAPSPEPVDLTPYVKARLPDDCVYHSADRADVIALSCERLRQIFVFDLSHPEKSWQIPEVPDFHRGGVALSPDGEWLVVSNRIFHIPESRWVALGDGAAVETKCFGTNPGILLSWSAKTIRRWDLSALPGNSAGDSPWQFSRAAPPAPIRAVGGKRVMFSNVGPKPVAGIPASESAYSSALNASGNFASFLGSASIEIWSLADSRHPTLASRFPLPTAELGHVSLVLSDDGKTVVVYGGETSDLLFSPQHHTGVPLRGATSRTLLLEISRSGHRILATLDDGTASLWDTNEPDRPLLVMTQFPDLLNLARFGTTGDQIVTATDSGWIRTWDVSPAGLRKALDGASPICLTVQQRERYLQERRTEAEEGFRICERGHSRGK